MSVSSTIQAAAWLEAVAATCPFSPSVNRATEHDPSGAHSLWREHMPSQVATCPRKNPQLAQSYGTLGGADKPFQRLAATSPARWPRV